MLEILSDVFLSLRDEASTYSDGVRIWMRLMALSFFASVLFVGVSRRAYWILALALATILGLVLGRLLMPDFPRGTLGGVLHLTLWPIALAGLWWPPRPVLGSGLLARIYPAWAIWVSLLIGLSLGLDLRALLF